MLLISWFISKYYYTKSTKDDIAAFNKLPQMVKQILLKTKADELTVLELNKILQKKKFMILTQMIYFLINVVLNVALKNQKDHHILIMNMIVFIISLNVKSVNGRNIQSKTHKNSRPVLAHRTAV